VSHRLDAPPEVCTRCSKKRIIIHPACLPENGGRRNSYADYVCYDCGEIFETKMRLDNRVVIARNRLFEILGGVRCMCNDSRCYHEKKKCSISDKRLLDFDHIGGEGIERRFPGYLKGKIPSRVVYEWYAERPTIARQELQSLCRNCNWLKAVLNKEYSRKVKQLARSKILT
jgi:hypothetical protein